MPQGFKTLDVVAVTIRALGYAGSVTVGTIWKSIFKTEAIRAVAFN